jgi:hypothetical protein
VFHKGDYVRMKLSPNTRMGTVEDMEHLLRPTAARGYQLKHDPRRVTWISSRKGCTVEVSMSVHDNCGERRCSVRSALEGIQHLFVPFATGVSELEDHATAGAIQHRAIVHIATCRGRAVDAHW